MINVAINISDKDISFMIRSHLKESNIDFQYSPFIEYKAYTLIFYDILTIEDISKLQELRIKYPDSYIIILGPRDIEIVQSSLIIEPIGYINHDSWQKDLENVFHSILPLLKQQTHIYTIENRYGISNIQTDSIYYVESIKHYLTITTISGDYTERNTIQGFLDKINNSDFISIHRSYIVNIDKIQEILTNELQLEDGTVLPISRTYKNDVLAILQQRKS